MSEATAAEPITLTIDGKQITAAKGELIIEAAERAGIFIPRFCYHPRMKPVGMCRMCLVEVSGPRGPSLQPACYVSVADGQEIETGSPAARKAQEGVLEFLLLNHPLDCPVCDKGGECPLQDQAMSHGPGESRFIEEKRHWAKPIEIGPLTLLDRERCIQCARCTRFAEEVAGEPLIDFLSRGDKIEVAIFPERPFDSYFSGNTVQICPVGALTAKPYRFAARPWDLEQVETTCTFCSVGCRVAMQSSAGEVVRLLGIDSDPVNRSFLCDRGRYGFESIHSEKRLGAPMLREGEGFVEASWNEALSKVAEGLRQAIAAQGASSVGIIGGARLANEDQYAWSKLARAVIGTDNVDAQLGDGLPAGLVASLPQATIDQACSARVVILLAGELREELPVLHLRLRQAAAHEGLKIIDCSPVPTSMKEVAAASLPARPGEAAQVAAALLGEGESSPEIDKARALLDGLEGGEVVLVLGRSSLAESPESLAAAAARLVAGLPGLKVLPALRRANVRGAIDMGLSPGLLPGRVGLEEARQWYEEQWGSLPAGVGLGTREMLEAAAAGTLSALVLLGADPLSDFPDHGLAARALDEVPFLVAVDTFSNPSVALADVVLPAAGFGERPGTTTNLEGRVSRLAQKVVPPGTARPDWVIAAEISEHLGLDLGFDHVEGIWEEIEEIAPAHRGATVSAVYGRGSHDGLLVPVRKVELSRRRLDPIATPGIEAVNLQGAPMFAGSAIGPSGELAQSVAIEESTGGESPGELEGPSVRPGGSPRPEPASFDPASWPAPPPPAADSYSFRLVTRRSLYDLGTLVQAAGSLAGLAPAPAVHLRPKDAEQLGVREGDEVRLRSARGELRGAVRVDPDVPAGVVMTAFGLWRAPDRGVNALIDADEPAQLVRVETVGE